MKQKLLSLIITFCLTFSIKLFAQQIIFNEIPENPKLILGLSQVVTQTSLSQVMDSTTVQNFRLMTFKDNNQTVLVDAIAEGEGSALLQELTTAGVEIVAQYNKTITCWVKISSLSSLVNKSSNIHWLQPVLRPQYHSGVVQSQGDIAQRSNIARQLTGMNGAGIKIGVLSESYNKRGGAAAGVTAGELPGTTNTEGYTTPVTVLKELPGLGLLAKDEGRALLEIVHDVAPAAQLYFYTADVSQADFAKGIKALADAGCTVIIDDVSYVDEPYFQDGIVAQAVDNAVTTKGVSYFSAAANGFNHSYEASYKSSTFHPFSGALSGETAHNFGTNDNPIYYLPILINGIASFSLQWDEPYYSLANGSPGSASDMNFYLLAKIGSNYVTVNSSRTNNIGKNPYELIDGVVIPGIYYLLITKKSGTDPGRLKFVSQGNDVWDFTPSVVGLKAGTCVGHANAAGAIAVGASNYDQTPAFGASPALIENFSSKGGTPILFAINGTRLVTPVDRFKPEIVAPDNVNTSFFGGYDYDGDGKPNFSGTSAAVAHAGAVAALLLQGKPTATPTEIKNTLIKSCLDMDDPTTPTFDKGFDYLSGNGLIRTDIAVLSIKNADCPAIKVTITRPTIFCEGDSVVLDANTGEGYTFQWKLNGGILTDKIQSKLIVKESGLYSVDITHGECTLSSDTIFITKKPGIPLPTTISRSISYGTTITAGNGLQASSNCHPSQTATYSGGTVSYDGGNQVGDDPTAIVTDLTGNISSVRVAITWQKRGTGGISRCGDPDPFGIPYNDEISFILVAPDNTTINLIKKETYAEGTFPLGVLTTTFEEGGASIGTTPATGTFASAQSLSKLIGKNGNGTWTLVAQDYFRRKALCVTGFSVTVFSDAAGDASNITWWDSQTGGTQVGSDTEYIPTDVEAGTYTYYAEAGCTDSNLSCSTSLRVPATLKITCDPQAGSVSSDATVCSGDNSGTLTASDYTGDIVRWESSTDSFSSVITSIENTTDTQSYTNLTETTQYRAVVKNGTCPESSSTFATITITPVSVSGSVSPDATVCSGDNSGSLTASGYTGDIVRWESSTDSFNSVITPIENTTNTQAYLNLTQTTQYRAVIKNGVCAEMPSSFATITVTPITVGGSVSSDATVCSGDNGSSLTASGYTGDIVRWESSTDSFNSVITPIENTTNTQAYLNLTQTTQYRAVIKNGVCAELPSSFATITVTPPSIGGSASSDATVCSGSNSGTVSICGYAGDIVRWESSTDNFNSVITSITNTTAVQSYTNLTVTTEFRAVLKNGICAEVPSSFATITVTPVTVGGSVSTNATVCSGDNTGTLTASGYTGNIIRWESSTDSFNTVITSITNVTNTQSYLNLTQTTQYRAVIQNSPCSSANSTFATITITPVTVGGSVSAGTTVCSGSNSGSLTASGYTGDIIRWESSTDSFSSVITPITNITNTQSYLNLTQTTQYRAVIKNGTCAEVPSSFSTITVPPATVGGSVSASTTVCLGSNGGTLTASGYTGGNIIRWESSTDSFNSVITSITNTTTTQSYLNLTQTTQFRAVIKNGTCAEVPSSFAIITVSSVTVGGSISASLAVCSGTNSGLLTAIGFTGSIIGWESSTDNFGSTTSIANTNTTQGYSNLTQTTQYRAIIQNGSCSIAKSAFATVTVEQQASFVTQPTNQRTCHGQNTYFSVVAIGSGVTYRWQENRGNGWNDLTNAGIYSGTTTAMLAITGADYTMDNYKYRCVISTNNTCGVQGVNSDEVTLTVRFSADSITILYESPIVGLAVVQQAVLYIIANNIIKSNARVDYRAGNSITLNPGFQVQNGSVFRAKIERPCTDTTFGLPTIIKR